jgi:hypothetical protein
VTRCVREKNRPNCSPNHFRPNEYLNFATEKEAKKVAQIQKEKYKRKISPNLATLLVCEKPSSEEDGGDVGGRHLAGEDDDAGDGRHDVDVEDALKQGCHMAYFQTKNPDLGKFWRVLQWKMFLYYMAICSILWLFGIFLAI